MAQDIAKIVRQLQRKYDTTSPFEIAGQRKINVYYEPLGSIRGYYTCFCRVKSIHINTDLDDDKQLFVCAHELGHAVLHPKSNTPFLQENTLFSVNKLEVEANRFASCMLYPDDVLLEYADFSIDQISQALSLPLDLVEWRYEQIVK